MKLLLKLFVVLVHLAVLASVIQNWSVPVDVTFAQWHYAHIALGYIILKLYVLGLLTMGITAYLAHRKTATQMKQWELRREKAEVQAETQSDQVQALESKIKTLEKALDTALSQSARKDN